MVEETDHTRQMAKVDAGEKLLPKGRQKYLSSESEDALRRWEEQKGIAQDSPTHADFVEKMVELKRIEEQTKNGKYASVATPSPGAARAQIQRIAPNKIEVPVVQNTRRKQVS